MVANMAPRSAAHALHGAIPYRAGAGTIEHPTGHVTGVRYTLALPGTVRITAAARAGFPQVFDSRSDSPWRPYGTPIEQVRTRVPPEADRGPCHEEAPAQTLELQGPPPVSRPRRCGAGRSP